MIAAKSAKFIQSFAAIGLIPDSGGTWVLPRLVGQARALGLALTGEPLEAERAADWGLIWKAVDDEQLDAEVDALAARFAAGPTRGLAADQEMLRESWGQSLDAELDRQRDAMRELGFSDDYREGVAAFMEKRKPSSPAGDQSATSAANFARSILPPEITQTIGPRRPRRSAPRPATGARALRRSPAPFPRAAASPRGSGRATR